MNIQIDGINYGKKVTSWINTLRPEKQLPLLSVFPDLCYIIKNKTLVIVGTSRDDSAGILAIPLKDLDEFADELKEISETFSDTKG